MTTNHLRDYSLWIPVNFSSSGSPHSTHLPQSTSFGMKATKGTSVCWWSIMILCSERYSLAEGGDIHCAVTGLAGMLSTYHVRVSSRNWKLDCTTGSDYHFDALGVDKEPNELSQAFATLFHANRSITFLDILQAYVPILQHLVRILLRPYPLLSAESEAVE